MSSGSIVGTPTSLPAPWKLVSGYLIGPTANLTDAALSGANLSGVALTGATLTGATLNNVSSGGITGTPASLPAPWKLVNGYLIGPAANLTGANLTGANLTSATLTGATITGANLQGSTLTKVSSGSIIGTPVALPPAWRLIKGYLIGPGATLKGAALASAPLSGTTLTTANLKGANLKKANLSSADMTGANLTLADMTGATLTGTNVTHVTWSSYHVSRRHEQQQPRQHLRRPHVGARERHERGRADCSDGFERATARAGERGVGVARLARDVDRGAARPACSSSGTR